MTEISFHWKAEWITPRLVTAIGRLVLEWSGIDNEVTRMCEGFWLRKYGSQGIPRSFDHRSVELKGYAAELYATEPDEYRIFFANVIMPIRNHEDTSETIGRMRR